MASLTGAVCQWHMFSADRNGVQTNNAVLAETAGFHARACKWQREISEAAREMPADADSENPDDCQEKDMENNAACRKEKGAVGKYLTGQIPDCYFPAVPSAKSQPVIPPRVFSTSPNTSPASGAASASSGTTISFASP